MKLVVYYSRTGNTKKVAEKMAEVLKCDLDEIQDQKNRSGIFGWLRGGVDAFNRRLTQIRHEKDPKKYDLVIIGTPVWAGTMTPAVRTYLEQNEFKKVAFFCTYGGQEGKTFQDMEKIIKKPIATLGLHRKDLGKGIAEFCKKLE